jgi:hypothetical protein
MPKRDLNSLIANAQPDRPQVNRGPGYQLSTTNPDAEIETKNTTATHARTKVKAAYRTQGKRKSGQGTYQAIQSPCRPGKAQDIRAYG